jgi:SAM-dependent methyltransferase
MKIPHEKDVLGKAILDYSVLPDENAKILVHSPDFDTDHIPVSYLFRTYNEMPKIEQRALDLSFGKILDVGAGAGCHSKHLKQKGHNVTAIEISPLAYEYLLENGINSFNTSVYNFNTEEKFDTILLLMNGLGIAGNVKNLKTLIDTLTGLLTENGQILIDSSDLSYLSDDEEITTITYQMQYKNILSDPFDWLYLSYKSLSFLINMYGYHIDKIIDGSHYDYLAKISKNS